MIKELTVSEFSTIDEYIKSHKNGNVFHSSTYAYFFSMQSNYESRVFVHYDAKDRIDGVVVVYIISENGFLSFFSKRGIVWGGPVADNNDVITELLSYIKVKLKYSAIYIEIRNLFPISDKGVFTDSQFCYEDHLDIIFDLSKSESSLWSDVKSTRKKQINRSKKRDVHAELLANPNKSEIQRCYFLLAETYKRVGLPISSELFFVEAFKILQKENIIKLFVAKIQERIIGFRIVLCYNKLVYDWYAGADYDELDKYPNDLLPWEVIIWSKENGYSWFDFGGAGKPNIPYGVRDYKLKFGGELVNYGRFLLVNNKIIYNAGKIGIGLYRKLKRK